MSCQIAVIIPCYKAKTTILSVLSSIPESIFIIVVVDDCCPERTGDWVKENTTDSRVCVVFNKKNMGVGGATMTGFLKAAEYGADIFVKIDADGQMKPEIIPSFVQPLIARKADFVKGNRFYSLEFLVEMPKMRVFGNALLSFISKFSSGYWNIMDPTNGFIAVPRKVFMIIPHWKIAQGFFFESDLLFRLYTVRAVVFDYPMPALYPKDQKSNLKIAKIIFPFALRYMTNIFKRIFYTYFLRDFNMGSLSLLLGFLMSVFGATYGLYFWIHNNQLNQATPVGTVVLSSLFITLGFLLLLTFLNYDFLNVPRQPIHPYLPDSDSQAFSQDSKRRK